MDKMAYDMDALMHSDVKRETERCETDCFVLGFVRINV